jgi:hypothetical protein
MQFIISFKDHDTKMIRTIDAFSPDAETLVEIFAIEHPNSEIIKVAPYPAQPLTKETE